LPPPKDAMLPLSFQATYDDLSVPELRDQLGVAGTDMALDWEQDEFVAVLEEIDRVCMPIMVEHVLI